MGEGGHWVNNFRIILYFPKDFEECVTCKNLLNYCNLLEKFMFKDKFIITIIMYCLIN